MKSRTVLTTLLSLILLPVLLSGAAEAKSSVTVLDLQAKGVDADMTAAISMGIRDLLEEKGYEVPSREDMTDTLEEDLQEKIDDGNCKSLSCFAEVGGAMGTDLVLAGSVAKLRKSVVVKLVLVDSLDEEVIRKSRSRIKSRNEEEITEKTAALALGVVRGDDADQFASDEEDLLGGEDEDEADEEEEEEDDEDRVAAVPVSPPADEEDNFITQEPPKPATFFTYAKWTGLGLTLALGGVTGFTGFWAKKRQDDYNNTYVDRRDFDFDAKADAENYALTTNILIGVTSAAAAATITFFVLDALDIGRDNDEDEVIDALLLNPWVAPNAAGATVFMRF